MTSGVTVSIVDPDPDPKSGSDPKLLAKLFRQRLIHTFRAVSKSRSGSKTVRKVGYESVILDP
jgi:hypothetical protein